jgi:hypothetical protein
MKDDYEPPVIDMGDVAAHIEKKQKPPPKIKGENKDREAIATTAASKTILAQRRLVTQDTYREIVEKYGDPLEALALIAFDSAVGEDGKPYFVNPVEVRASALKEVIQYGHAKLKTIEHTGANGAPLEFKMNIVQNILQMMTKDETTEPRTITATD